MPDVARARKTTARRNPTVLGFALLTLWFGGHASAEAAQTPATETAPSALEDGLQPVPIRGAGMFWVRPGVDLRAYDRVALKPVTLEYKKTPRHYRIDRPSTGILLTERDLERLQQSFYEAFKNGLASGKGFAEQLGLMLRARPQAERQAEAENAASVAVTPARRRFETPPLCRPL